MSAFGCWCGARPKRGFWVTCLSVTTCANIVLRSVAEPGLYTPGAMLSKEGASGQPIQPLAPPPSIVCAWPRNPCLSSQPLH